MVNETVHVVVRGKGILTFDVSIHANEGEDVTVVAKLTQINGNKYAIQPGGVSLSELVTEYVSDWFNHHDNLTWCALDYNDAMYVAEMKARERLGYTTPSHSAMPRP